MSSPSERDDALFADALALPAVERSAFLDRACSGDAALRRRIEALLNAHERAGNFMTSPAAPRADEFSSPAVMREHAPGERIGRYKLLEKLGEGGWGVVYLAEQEEPVRRRVALKVIKLGMDTAAVIARFEAERQALALMEHPNIARVFDGGATDMGRPYFVMELVRGVAITNYCDQQRLTTRQRLELFTQVCHAVQHAHQKGIIHRDLKPSNILVTLHDDKPVPKVIDFGIAKATEQRLTEKTLFTRFHQFVGTPAYMSPEQTGISGVEVDTRSDIYSLGVLLYELLAGRTPFDTRELLERGYDEIQRAIREEEPPRPSTRLNSLSPEERTTTAERRQLRAADLVSQLRGDLDWIVMKCLQKDRARRYESANVMALDLGRYLRHEPVLARPDSVGYRVAKFVRRHRMPVAFGAVVVVALAGGLVGTITPLAFAAVVAVVLGAGLIGTVTQAQRAQRHAVAADAQRQLAENERMRAEGERRLAEAERRRADEAARAASNERDFALRQLSRATAMVEFNHLLIADAAPSGKPFTALQLLERAEQIMQRESADTDENRVEILVTIGRQYEIMGETTKARSLLSTAHELARKLDDPALRARTAAALGHVIGLAGDFERGEQLMQEALAELGDDSKYVPARVNCLALGSRLARARGDIKIALLRAEEAQRTIRQSRHGSPLERLDVTVNLAGTYNVAGRHREAAEAYENAFAQFSALGRDDTDRAASLLSNWANALQPLGRPLEAEQHYRRSIAIRSADGTEQNISGLVLLNLAVALHALHRLDEAAGYAERALGQVRSGGAESHVSWALYYRAAIAVDQGDLKRAADLLAEVDQRWRSTMPENFFGFADLARQRSRLALARGDIAAALAEAEKANALTQASALGRKMPRVLLCSAEVKLRLGRLDEARIDASEAIALFQEVSGAGAGSSYIGHAKLVLAHALAAQGQREEARAAFASALDHLRPTVGEDHPHTREATRGLQDL